MAPFQDHEIRRSRMDAAALVYHSGVLWIDPQDQPASAAWLLREGYTTHTLDGRAGMQGFRHALGRWLDWEGQFGYRLEDGQGSLDALADGFTVTVPYAGGLVLNLLGIEHLLVADARWTQGLLQIIMEHSFFHLACGRRFWALLPVADTATIPAPWGAYHWRMPGSPC